MSFLENVLFSIGSFDVLMWHLLVAIAVLVVIALIIVIAVLVHKRAKRAVEEQPAEAHAVEEQPAEQVVQPQEEQPAEQPVAEAQPEEPAEAPAEPQEAPVEEAEEEPVEEEAEEESEEPEQAEGEAKDEKKRPKIYHISLRDDGKWQVKLQKGAKPLKLFDTQAQAIAFAKEKAKNQEGNIMIHKVNGQIRKTKY